MYERYENENSEMEQQIIDVECGNEQYDDFIQKNSRKKHGRKNSMMRKTASVASLALVFGLVSGGAFQATYAAGNVIRSNQATETEAATETVANAVKTMTAGTTTAAADSNTATAVTATTAAGTEMTVSQVAETVLPATVAINCTGTTTVNTMWGNAQQEYTSCGTGIIVGKSDTELLIATNNHVVEDSSTVSVDFIDETSADAQIKGTDSDNDLAVIAVPLEDISEDTLSQISVAELGDFDDVKVGEQVVAIGNALGYGQSVTTGIVSALNREVTTEQSSNSYLLQTDAAINPGNSGGALCNMYGQVIAINSAKYSDESVEGMGYAIPINVASPILDELMNRVTRTAVDESESSWLGIQGQDLSSTVAAAYNMPAGIYVTGVSEDSPAETAGIQNGDIIVKFDGTSAETISALQKLMTYYASGETVTVTVERVENGEYVEKELQVTLGHQESAAQTSDDAQNDQVQNGQNTYGNYGGYGSYYGSYGSNGSYGSMFPQIR